MFIKYNTDELKTLIQNISDLTGISISVLDENFTLLANCSQPSDFCSRLQSIEGQKNICQTCDHMILQKCRIEKKLAYHICRAGLYDSAMPILKEKTVAGYIIMGRIRSTDSHFKPENFPFSNADLSSELKEKYNQLPYLSQKQLDALYRLMPSILFEHAIQIIYDPMLNDILQYINTNLQQRLSVTQLCAQFHLSVNALYKLFRENLHTTVNDYITAQRIRRAKELLTASGDPVYKIAEACGIENYTYFCKLFKAATGCTPTDYRKSLTV